MRPPKLTICLGLVSACHAALPTLFWGADPPVVDLGYAQYQGVTNKASNITNFLGIRYADAPVGEWREYRWRAPRYPATVEGVQQAKKQPPKCYQASIGKSNTNPLRRIEDNSQLNEDSEQIILTEAGTRFADKRALEGGDESEDCLFLNVHVPGSKISSKNLPVVIWIHGDGYHSGSASSYNGEDLVRESGHNVIVVVIQYRLGLFGFLAGREVKNAGNPNAGLLDQQFALKWVNRHIQKFGGDPDKVTIWGKSSGVIQHVVANNGRTHPPLFQRVMTNSAFLPPQYNFDHEIHEYIYSQVVKKTGCGSAADSFACLRRTDSEALQTANTNMTSAAFYGTSVWTPCVDGDLIWQRPVEALKQRKINGNALLSMENFNEGVIFVDTHNPPVSLSDFAGNIFPTLGIDTRHQVAQVYKDAYSTRPQEIQAMAMFGESFLKCPSYFLMDAFLDKGYPVYKAQFAVEPAHHPDDIGYFFPSTFHRNYENMEFLRSLVQSFLTFVIAGDPNAAFSGKNSSTPTWHDFNTLKEMVFDKAENGEPHIAEIERDMNSDAFLDRCSYWQDIGPQTPR